jgi:hypothetical protein
MKSVDCGVEVDSDLGTVSTSNEEGFARLMRLYARPGDTVVDPTYGRGVFWSQVDCSQYNILATDLTADRVDLRSLPYADDSADLVVLDPPYRYTPARNKRHEDTPGHGAVDALYALQSSGLTNTAAVLDLYRGGIVEASRVLRRGGFLIVKCQDTVQDGKQVWVHVILMRDAEVAGFACRDLMVVVTKSPTKTRWPRQRHLRKAHSYFLVFRKGGQFPFGIPPVCER